MGERTDHGFVYLPDTAETAEVGKNQFDNAFKELDTFLKNLINESSGASSCLALIIIRLAAELGTFYLNNERYFSTEKYQNDGYLELS